jgi:DNA-binding NarL/FixJ family response regulator
MKPTILEGMEGLLSRWGSVAVTGANAAEIGRALQARALEPDIVLADYHLDEGTGSKRSRICAGSSAPICRLCW